MDLTEPLERILSQPRFDAPAESWWDRLWERLITEALRLIAAVVEAVGGPVVAAFIALGIVAAVTVFTVVRLAGRRAATIEDRLELGRLLELGADPEAYLRDAERASVEGDHASAIRLRFIGGVLDLGRRGRLRYEPGLTTGAIADQLDDPAFDRLAAQFDAVAYGNVPAGPEDDLASRRGWARMREPA